MNSSVNVVKHFTSQQWLCVSLLWRAHSDDPIQLAASRVTSPQIPLLLPTTTLPLYQNTCAISIPRVEISHRLEQHFDFCVFSFAVIQNMLKLRKLAPTNNNTIASLSTTASFQLHLNPFSTLQHSYFTRLGGNQTFRNFPTFCHHFPTALHKFTMTPFSSSSSNRHHDLKTLPSSSDYLFSFAVLADLQYADYDNSKSFAGKDRYHRNAITQVERLFNVAKQKNQEKEEKLSHHRMLFAVHFGDLLDINASHKNTPAQDISHILSVIEQHYPRRCFHMTANHDFYNLDREQVLDFFGVGLGRDSVQGSESTKQDSRDTTSHNPILPSHYRAHTLHPVSGKPLNWDDPQHEPFEYDHHHSKLWSQLYNSEAPQEHPEAFIWNDDKSKILRLKRDLHSELPSTLPGWIALNKHEEQIRKLDQPFIEQLAKEARSSDTHDTEKHSDKSANSPTAANNYEPNTDSLLREGHYSFSVDRFRFLVLDTYDISILAWPENHPKRKKAEEILLKHHPEGVSTSLNSSTHLEGDKKRFVAFNGAIDEPQMTWIEEEIKAAMKQNQRVVICSHVPLLPSDEQSSAYLWNYREVLDRIYSATSGKRGVVAAFFAGHAHRGGYQQDEHGAHHLTFEGAVEWEKDCFAEIFVYNDRFEVKGSDVIESRVLALQ